MTEISIIDIVEISEVSSDATYISTIDQIKSFFINGTTSLIVFGAISVGIAIFIMSITNTEHAPAAGIALGLVINQWSYNTILLILGAIIWMSAVRKLLKSHMMDLISPLKKSENG